MRRDAGFRRRDGSLRGERLGLPTEGLMATGREWDLPESAVTDRKFSLRRALLKRAVVYGGIAGAGYLGWKWHRGFDRDVLVAGRDPSKNALEFARATEAE